jgi:hypothetical protein
MNTGQVVHPRHPLRITSAPIKKRPKPFHLGASPEHDLEGIAGAICTAAGLARLAEVLLLVVLVELERFFAGFLAADFFLAISIITSK